MTTVLFTTGSLVINGTGKLGYQDYDPQSSAPSAPASNTVRYYADNLGRYAYILNDGFTRTFDTTTASGSNSYTYPDASANVVLDTATQTLTNKNLTDFSNIIAASSINLLGGSVNVAASPAPIAGQAFVATGASAGTWQFVTDNAGLSASVAGNAFTINLTQYDGASTPSTNQPAKISFRNATVATGSYTQVNITAATSITIPSGTTIGTSNSYGGFIYVYALNNAGTISLAVSLAPFALDTVVTSTAISGGASATTLYSTSVQTNVPIQYLGKIIAPQATAGTWTATPTEIYIRVAQDYAADRVCQNVADIETINSSGIPAPLAIGAAGTIVSTTDGATLAYNTLSTDSTLTGNGFSIPFSLSIGLFGTGSSGSATITVTTSTNIDGYFDNLTINNGVTLTYFNARLYVAGTLTVLGTLANIGTPGNNGSGGAGGTGGAALTSGSIASLGSSAGGGNGGGTGGSGSTGGSISNSVGGNGGAGGASTGSAGAAGTTTAITAANGGNGTVGTLYTLMSGKSFSTLVNAGAGGGGGAGGTGGGGGGGAGGGVMIVFASTVTGNGTISVAGGTGGNGQTGVNAAGGGGGGGGYLGLIYQTNTFTGSTSVAGGVHGNGSGTGGNGVSGSSGTLVSFQI